MGPGRKNRGNRRDAVFHKPADYDAFVEAVADARRRLPLDRFGYGLMSNHFHRVLRSQGVGDLGRRMRWLLTVHAQRCHRHDKTTGHVSQGRYKAFPVQDDDHLATVLRDFERNPFHAELVLRAEHGNWSSRPGWLAGDPPPRDPSGVDRVNEPLSADDLRFKLGVELTGMVATTSHADAHQSMTRYVAGIQA